MGIFRTPLNPRDALNNASSALAALPGKRGFRRAEDYAMGEEQPEIDPRGGHIFSGEEENLEDVPQEQMRLPGPAFEMPGAGGAPEGLASIGRAPARPAAAPMPPRAKDLASVMARAGTLAAREEMNRPQAPAASSPMDALRQRVLSGDVNAQQAVLNAANGNPSLAFSMIYGRTGDEAARADEAENARRFDAGLGEQQANRYEKARQFDVGAQQQSAELEATTKYKNTLNEINRMKAEGEISLAQAKLAEEKARNDALNEIQNRKLDLENARFDAEINDPLKVAARANAGESAGLDLDLKRAQVAAAKRQAAGEQSPQEMRAKTEETQRGKAALVGQIKARANALMADPANPMNKEQALSRAYSEYADQAAQMKINVQPEEITLMDPYATPATGEGLAQLGVKEGIKKRMPVIDNFVGNILLGLNEMTPKAFGMGFNEKNALNDPRTKALAVDAILKKAPQYSRQQAEMMLDAYARQ